MRLWRVGQTWAKSTRGYYITTQQSRMMIFFHCSLIMFTSVKTSNIFVERDYISTWLLLGFLFIFIFCGIWPNWPTAPSCICSCTFVQYKSFINFHKMYLWLKNFPWSLPKNIKQKHYLCLWITHTQSSLAANNIIKWFLKSRNKDSRFCRNSTYLYLHSLLLSSHMFKWAFTQELCLIININCVTSEETYHLYADLQRLRSRCFVMNGSGRIFC